MFERLPTARTKLTEHGVAFETAATVLQDVLALTVYDEAHSEFEERWFTIGRTGNGTHLRPRGHAARRSQL